MPVNLGESIFAFALTLGSVYVPAIFPDAVYLSRKLESVSEFWRRLAFGLFLWAVAAVLVLFSPLKQILDKVLALGGNKAPLDVFFFSAGITTWLLTVPVTLLCVALKTIGDNSRELRRRREFPGTPINDPNRR